MDELYPPFQSNPIPRVTICTVGKLGVNSHFLMSLRTRTPRHYIGFILNRSIKDQLSSDKLLASSACLIRKRRPLDVHEGQELNN